MTKIAFSKVLTIITVCSLIVMAVATMHLHYTIDPKICNNCGECVEECPEECISTGEVDGKEVHIIDIQSCTNCGVCAEICPEEAIYADSTNLSLVVEDKEDKKETEKKGTKKKKKKDKKSKN